MKNNQQGYIKTTLDNGTIVYRLHGKYHRIDGPAVEYPNGATEWWIKGKLIYIEDPYEN